MRKILLSLFVSLALHGQAQAFDLDLNKLRDVGSKLKALKPVSENDEIQIGEGIAANILGAVPLVQDEALQRYVNRVGKWLALHSARPQLPWRFGVLDTETVNAFATPGGYVFVTRGLLERMNDEAELAGVLAHEIGHVVERHVLNTLKKGALVGLAGDALSEYASRKGGKEYAKLTSAGTEIFTRGLDKSDEYAADRLGPVLAARAGYDPFGLAAVLQTLSEINPGDNAVALMFQTHPAPEDRLERMLQVAEPVLQAYSEQPRLADRFADSVKVSHLGAK